MSVEEQKIFYEKEIEIIKKRIVENYTPERIVLFGSFARGDINEDSDVDVLVIKDTNESPRERIRNVRKKIPHNIPIDVIVYTPEEVNQNIDDVNSFISCILNEGKLLYERL